MRAKSMMIAMVMTLPAFAATGWAAGSIQPAKGTYSFHSNLVAMSGGTSAGGGDSEHYGNIVYPGPNKTGTVFTFSAIGAEGPSPSLTPFHMTVINLPKTPAAGATSWSGNFSYTDYDVDVPSSSGTGTFSATISYGTSASFIIQFVPVIGGCAKTIDIAAWHN